MYKLFTHNDLDGIGCACVLKHVVDVLSFKYRLSNTSQVDVSYLSYDKVNSVIQQFINDKEYENYTLIFITDISVDEETAKLIDKTIGDKVVLLDHHQHLEWLDEYPWATVSPFKYKPFENEASSGTYLLWDYLRYPANRKISKRFPELAKNGEFEMFAPTASLNDFVELVTDYDTWAWKSKAESSDENEAARGKLAKNINDLFDIYGRCAFMEETLIKLKNGYKLFTLSHLEEKLLQLNQESINRYIEQKEKEIRPLSICGYNAAVVFADRNQSELGNTICANHPEFDLCIMLCMGRDDVQIRSTKENVDVSILAKEFGGGGHKHASGFHIKSENIGKFISMIFTKE